MGVEFGVLGGGGSKGLGVGSYRDFTYWFCFRRGLYVWFLNGIFLIFVVVGYDYFYIMVEKNEI